MVESLCKNLNFDPHHFIKLGTVAHAMIPALEVEIRMLYILSCTVSSRLAWAMRVLVFLKKKKKLTKKKMV